MLPAAEKRRLLELYKQKGEQVSELSDCDEKMSDENMHDDDLIHESAEDAKGYGDGDDAKEEVKSKR